MPVDWRVSFHIDITLDACATGQSNILFRVAEQFQAEQRIEPLPESFQNAFAADVFAAVADVDIAGAAESEAPAVNYCVRSGVDLNTVFSGNGSQVFTHCDVNRELFVDKVYLGHGTTFIYLNRENGLHKPPQMVLVSEFDFQKSWAGPDTENHSGLLRQDPVGSAEAIPADADLKLRSDTVYNRKRR